MPVTPSASAPRAPRPARSAEHGSAAGFVLVALGAVVAALGVVQLEVQGAPWPAAAPSSRPAGLGGSVPAARQPRMAGAMGQARLLRSEASSGAASAEGRYDRTGANSGQ